MTAARHKCPRRIGFAGELPRSDTGKLSKHRVLERLLLEAERGG